MPPTPKLATKDIYEFHPDSENKAGDIWVDLPALGHLRRQHCKGIIITPACDLSNRKSETATYLPIVPVESWLLSRACRAEHLRIVKGQLIAAAIELPDWIDTPLGQSINAEECSALITSLEANQTPALPARQQSAALRAAAGLRILLAQCEYGDLPPRPGLLETLVGGNELKKTISGVVRNSYRSDIHFLPADGQPSPLSAMPEHCVALFRYPLTLPIEVLDAASDVRRPDWKSEVSKVSSEFPAALLAATARPMKISRLRPRMFSDLLARFIGLHVRMGAPDYTPDTVSAFSVEIGKSL